MIRSSGNSRMMMSLQVAKEIGSIRPFGPVTFAWGRKRMNAVVEDRYFGIGREPMHPFGEFGLSDANLEQHNGTSNHLILFFLDRKSGGSSISRRQMVMFRGPQRTIYLVQPESSAKSFWGAPLQEDQRGALVNPRTSYEMNSGDELFHFGVHSLPSLRCRWDADTFHFEFLPNHVFVPTWKPGWLQRALHRCHLRGKQDLRFEPVTANQIRLQPVC